MTSRDPRRSTDPLPASVESPSDAPAKGLVPDRVRFLAWLLDDAIPIVGNRRIGVDGFLSFLPGIGDAVGFGLSAVVVLAGVTAGCAPVTIVRMVFNALGESLLGTIPLLGPAISFVWKANDRNLRIIERDLADREATRRESWKVLVAALVLGVLGVVVLIAGLVLFAWLVIDRLF